MKTGFVILILVACFGAPAQAHQLDEYLQATTIDLARDHVTLEMRMTPGVEVIAPVLAKIDTDGNGIITEAEKRAYADCVLRDLALSIDGKPVRLRPISLSFATIAQMKEGLGDIILRFQGDVPAGVGHRKLVLSNHHQSAVSVYLVNCLSPGDPALRVASQHRNYQQSEYQLDYAQAGIAKGVAASNADSSIRRWGIIDAIVLLPTLAFLWLRRGLQAKGASEPGQASPHAA